MGNYIFIGLATAVVAAGVIVLILWATGVIGGGSNTCQSDSDCTVGSDKLAKKCVKDADTGQSTCQPIPCSTTTPCSSGQTCNSDGNCQVQCASNNDCASALGKPYCDSSNSCVACISGTDCGDSGDTCTSGSCMCAANTGKAPCASGSKCGSTGCVTQT